MVLEGSAVVEQVKVGSDSCEDGICSTSFSPSPSNGSYRVRISTNGILGSSNSKMFNGVIGT